MNLPTPVLKVVPVPGHWRSPLTALMRTVLLLVFLAIGCRLTLAIFGEALVLIGR